MTRFWWVRHGPTHQRAFVGWRDVAADLSDLPQLARLNAYLPRDALLISSDLRRASATADALGLGRQRLPHDPRLREFDFGDWDGRNYAEVAVSHPALSARFWEQPGDVAPPGGESWNRLATRVGEVVAAALHDHAGRDIIVVAHFGVILTQVQAALGITPYQALSHGIENLSVTTITHDGAGWQVGPINHLP